MYPGGILRWLVACVLEGWVLTGIVHMRGGWGLHELFHRGIGEDGGSRDRVVRWLQRTVRLWVVIRLP
jgi:hypothetical protein